MASLSRPHFSPSFPSPVSPSPTSSPLSSPPSPPSPSPTPQPPLVPLTSPSSWGWESSLLQQSERRSGGRRTYFRHPKPPQSYVELIVEALESSPTGALTLAGITQYLRRRYPFFSGQYQGWRNSLRHNLSLNQCFRKILRDPRRPYGKDNLWTLDPRHLPRPSSRKLTSSSTPLGKSPPFQLRELSATLRKSAFLAPRKSSLVPGERIITSGKTTSLSRQASLQSGQLPLLPEKTLLTVGKSWLELEKYLLPPGQPPFMLGISRAPQQQQPPLLHGLPTVFQGLPTLLQGLAPLTLRKPSSPLNNESLSLRNSPLPPKNSPLTKNQLSSTLRHHLFRLKHSFPSTQPLSPRCTPSITTAHPSFGNLISQRCLAPLHQFQTSTTPSFPSCGKLTTGKREASTLFAPMPATSRKRRKRQGDPSIDKDFQQDLMCPCKEMLKESNGRVSDLSAGPQYYQISSVPLLSSSSTGFNCGASLIGHKKQSTIHKSSLTSLRISVTSSCLANTSSDTKVSLSPCELSTSLGSSASLRSCESNTRSNSDVTLTSDVSSTQSTASLVDVVEWSSCHWSSRRSAYLQLPATIHEHGDRNPSNSWGSRAPTNVNKNPTLKFGIDEILRANFRLENTDCQEHRPSALN